MSSWQDYEFEKAKISAVANSADEYERLIREACKRLKIGDYHFKQRAEKAINWNRPSAKSKRLDNLYKD